MILKEDHVKVELTKIRLDMVSKLALEDAQDDYSSQRALRDNYWHLPFCILYVPIEASARDPGVNSISYIE
jgi:hypothetical protein